MLWNQVCNISLNCSDTLFQCLVFFHNLLQSRIIYQFCNTNSLRILNFRNPASDIYHHRRKDFYVTCLCLNPERRNCGILNLVCQITVNGQAVRSQYPTQSDNGLVELGTFENETVTVEVSLSKSIKPAYFGVIGQDTGVLKSICSAARGAEIETDGRRVTVSCTAAEGQTLFLPLAYDKGWKATVNGEPAALSKTAGTFLSLSLQEGENQIVLTYTPPGLRLGVLLMAAGLLLAVWFFRKGKAWALGNAFLKTAARFLFLAVFLAVLILVYLLPLLVYLAARLTK